MKKLMIGLMASALLACGAAKAAQALGAMPLVKQGSGLSFDASDGCQWPCEDSSDGCQWPCEE